MMAYDEERAPNEQGVAGWSGELKGQEVAMGKQRNWRKSSSLKRRHVWPWGNRETGENQAA